MLDGQCVSAADPDELVYVDGDPAPAKAPSTKPKEEQAERVLVARPLSQEAHAVLAPPANHPTKALSLRSLLVESIIRATWMGRPSGCIC